VIVGFAMSAFVYELCFVYAVFGCKASHHTPLWIPGGFQVVITLVITSCASTECHNILLAQDCITSVITTPECGMVSIITSCAVCRVQGLFLYPERLVLSRCIRLGKCPAQAKADSIQAVCGSELHCFALQASLDPGTKMQKHGPLVQLHWPTSGTELLLLEICLQMLVTSFEKPAWRF